MPAWYLIGGIAAGFAFLAGRGAFRRRHQEAAANAAGLKPVADLTHVPPALQKTALWALADGGFEQRVVRGAISRGAHDLEVTAFDLETLRERRGEWAYLPVEPPFRIGGVVSVVIGDVDRKFPHVLWKRSGRGDKLIDDDLVDRAGSITKLARDGLGLPRSYEAELPVTLPRARLDIELPQDWRAYGDEAFAKALLARGFAATLERAGRRDLVVELLDSIVVVYPAARDVVGADPFADLTSTALVVIDGVLAASLPNAVR